MAIERLRVIVTVDEPEVVVPQVTGQTLAVVGAANVPSANANKWHYVETTDAAILATFGASAAPLAGTPATLSSYQFGTELPEFLRWLRTKGVTHVYAAAPAPTLNGAGDAVTKSVRAEEIELWQELHNRWATVGSAEPTILTSFADMFASGNGDTIVAGDRAAAAPTAQDTLVAAIQQAARDIGCRAMISTPDFTRDNDIAWAVNNGDGRVFRIKGRAVSPFNPGPPATYPVNCAPIVAADIMDKNYWQRIANSRLRLGPQNADLHKRIGYGPADTTDSSLLSQAHIAAIVNLGEGYQLYGDRLGVPAGEEDDPRRFWHISHTMDFFTKYAQNRYNLVERDEQGASQFVTGYIHGVNDVIRRHTKPERNNVVDSGEIVVNQEESDDNNLKFDLVIDFNTPAVDWEIRARVTQ